MRGLTQATKDAIRAAPHTVAGVRIGTTGDDVVLINTSDRDITFGGKTYLARSNIMDIGGISESLDLKSENLNVVFGSADRAVATQLQTRGPVGWDLDVRQFWLDDEWTTVGETLLWSGSVTGYNIEHEGADAKISIEASTRFRNYRTIAGRKTNTASQQKHFAGDLGLDMAHRVGREFRWGSDSAGGESFSPSNATRAN